MTTVLRMGEAANRSPSAVRSPKRVHFSFIAVILAASLFMGMLVTLEIGRQIGVRQVETYGALARSGVGVVDGAVYGLLALLIGFSFNGAAARFDNRRSMIAASVNAAGTAWQRVDLLPPDSQATVRAGMKRYVDAVISSYTGRAGTLDLLGEPEEVAGAQAELWELVVNASLDPSGEKARVLLIPSTNEMFGAVEKERLARRIHPPVVVFIMLAIAAFSASLFGGYGLAAGTTRNWMYMVGVAATIAIATYVIIELEYPRRGLIRVDDMDHALVELRETMK
jgi:hypothetical protein